MILIRTNIRIYSYQENDTNEYPNIFVSRKLIRMNVRIDILIENIQIFKYLNIFPLKFPHFQALKLSNTNETNKISLTNTVALLQKHIGKNLQFANIETFLNKDD